MGVEQSGVGDGAGTIMRTLHGNGRQETDMVPVFCEPGSGDLAQTTCWETTLSAITMRVDTQDVLLSGSHREGLGRVRGMAI